ncbi:MAG: T9SS type A sorting domain-containing protein [Bacteroidota bacterium]
MSIRIFISVILVVIVSQTNAQDYSPFFLGHVWIYDILEDGTIAGTDTMRVDETLISGDTTFYYVSSHKNYTDGRAQEDPEMDIFLDGIMDLNNVYVRASLGDTIVTDLLYFKHTYTHLDNYSNQLFSVTSYFIGDYDLPLTSYKNCFWLKVSVSDSTGFVMAPDLGIVATIEDGSITRAMKENNLPPVTNCKLDLCEGDSVMLHARYIKDEGIYRDTLSGSDGSDSIVATSVTVLPVSESTVDITICYGESYYAGGTQQTASGVYYDTYVNFAGCDSTVTTNLTVEVCAGSFTGPDQNKKLRVYPNPTSGILHIEAASLEHIEVFDVFGKLIHESGNNTFDFSPLPQGCYYVKCYDLNHEFSVRKVIYQK